MPIKKDTIATKRSSALEDIKKKQSVSLEHFALIEVLDLKINITGQDHRTKLTLLKSVEVMKVVTEFIEQPNAIFLCKLMTILAKVSTDCIKALGHPKEGETHPEFGIRLETGLQATGHPSFSNMNGNGIGILVDLVKIVAESRRRVVAAAVEGASAINEFFEPLATAVDDLIKELDISYAKRRVYDSEPVQPPAKRKRIADSTAKEFMAAMVKDAPDMSYKTKTALKRFFKAHVREALIEEREEKGQALADLRAARAQYEKVIDTKIEEIRAQEQKLLFIEANLKMEQEAAAD